MPSPSCRLAPWVATCLTALVVVAFPDAAWAHNKLRGSAPADQASLTAVPARMELEFSERLDPQFTRIAVTADETTGTVDVDAAQVSGVRAYQPLPPSLPDGRYTVAYRVVSVDGHPVQGQVRFTLTAQRGAAGPSTAITPTVPADSGAVSTVASDERARRGRAPLLAAGVAVAFAVGVVAWVLLRRRRSV